MGLIRKTVQLCSSGVFVIVAILPTSALSAPVALPTTQIQVSVEKKAHTLVERARALIANAIPEERFLAEQDLVEATRICKSCPDAYAELGRMWLTEYTLGRSGISALQRAAAMAEIVKELNPNSPLGEYMGVEILLTIGRQTEAFKLYAIAKQEFPNHVDTLAFEARLWAEVEPLRALVLRNLQLLKDILSKNSHPGLATQLSNQWAKRKVARPLHSLLKCIPTDGCGIELRCRSSEIKSGKRHERHFSVLSAWEITSKALCN